MKIFLDSSSVEEIRKAQLALREHGSGLDGVTTNPTLAAQYALQSKREPRDVFLEIASIVKGAISVQTLGTDDYNPDNTRAEYFAREAHEIRKWRDFVVKMPCTPEGVRAARDVYPQVPVNMTLVFSEQNALAAAVAGARYCSPFVGRLDAREPGAGMRMAEEIVALYKRENFATEVLYASCRTPDFVTHAYDIGAHIATIPFKVFSMMDSKQLVSMQRRAKHYTPKKPADPLGRELVLPEMTDIGKEGQEIFLSDAKGAGYRIL